MKKYTYIARLIIVLSLLGGCTTFHKVNIKELEQNKNKTFKIGFVKVTGRSTSLFTTDKVEKKKEALNKIPVEKIIQVLSHTYGLKIDPETNRTVKIGGLWGQA